MPGPSMEPSDNASGHPRDASRGPAGCCCCVAWDWLHFHPIRSAPTPPPPLPRLPSSPQGRGDGRETLLILILVLWRDLPLCWFNGQIKIKNKVPCHQNSLSLSRCCCSMLRVVGHRQQGWVSPLKKPAKILAGLPRKTTNGWTRLIIIIIIIIPSACLSLLQPTPPGVSPFPSVSLVRSLPALSRKSNYTPAREDAARG